MDYLLKPIDTTELQEAVNRHIVKQKSEEQQLLVSNLLSYLQKKDPNDLSLPCLPPKAFFYDPSEILYCEGENNYTRFTFIKHRPMLVSKTLGEYEDLLDEHGFLRIHKSSLVNAKYVLKVDKEGVLMNDGKQLSISKRRKELVTATLKQH